MLKIKLFVFLCLLALCSFISVSKVVAQQSQDEVKMFFYTNIVTGDGPRKVEKEINEWLKDNRGITIKNIVMAYVDEKVIGAIILIHFQRPQ